MLMTTTVTTWASMPSLDDQFGTILLKACTGGANVGCHEGLLGELLVRGKYELISAKLISNILMMNLV